jgi:predicted ester cyclase
MSDPRLEAVRRFWEDAFNARNVDILPELFAEDYVNHAALPGTPPGAAGQAELMQRLWTAFPDAHFAIEHLVLDGDTVICIGEMTGTHEGELLGMPPSGRHVTWRQCHLIRAGADGLALEHRAIRDDAGLFRQMTAG